MKYGPPAITEDAIPRALDQSYQHVLDTYASEVNKTIDVWRRFADAELSYKPHERSTNVQGILKHELLSQRRFFAEFLEVAEPDAGQRGSPLPTKPSRDIRGVCEKWHWLGCATSRNALATGG